MRLAQVSAPDVRSTFDKSLKFLEKSGAPRFPSCATGPAAPPGAFPPRPVEPEETLDDGLAAASAGGPRGDEEDACEAETAIADDQRLIAADACFERTTIHYQAGAFQEALAEVTEAIQHSPHDPELYTLRARACLELEQYRNATEAAERAVELDADDPDARRARGIALLNTGEPRRAIDDFDFLLDENRHDADAYYHRGLAYAALGNHSEALADYAKAITKAPNVAETYFARHQLYKELGADEKAAADLKEGLWRRSRLTRDLL